MNRSRLVLLAVFVVAGSAAVYTATITSLSSLPPDKAPLVPRTVGGKAVASTAVVEMEFRLKDAADKRARHAAKTRA